MIVALLLLAKPAAEPSNYAGTNERKNMTQLSSKAMLVKLSISLPGNSRKDLKLTQDTIKSHNMGEKSGRWLKQIFPDEAYEPLVKISGEIRTWHYEHSLPWTDEGFRILPSAMHPEYCEKMREFKSRYYEAKRVFIAGLPVWEQWAKQAHNGTFDPSCYWEHKLDNKFNLELDFCPIPDGADFRCSVDLAELENMQQSVNARVMEAEKAAQADLWHRLAEPLQRMVERLSDEKATFRDSLVSNIADIIGLIPKLNITADPALSAFAAQAELLAKLTPQTLRDDKATRKQTAEQAQAILDKMASYL